LGHFLKSGPTPFSFLPYSLLEKPVYISSTSNPA
jgi:hypothetical protein